LKPNAKDFQASARRRQKCRIEASDGRKGTGVTAAVRTLLPEIEKLRAEGVSWADIAAALSEQGIVQGKDRARLTATRLTAIFSQVRSQERRRNEKGQQRHSRHDVVAGRDCHLHLTLAPEMASPAKAFSPSPSHMSEEDIRAVRFNRFQDLIKKD
jgi:hypothetical protein